MIPGFFVGWLDFIQIHAAQYFHYTPRQRLTQFARWLNVIPLFGFFALWLLKHLFSGGPYFGFIPLAIALLTITSFVAGILLSLTNVFWILIAARTRVALLATVTLCVLPTLWPAYRMGIFTPDAGRYATGQRATIYLHPSDVSFQIPQEWLDWNAKLHNNLHLTHRELERVRFGGDYEYGEVVNSALPFEFCAVHVGGEGWGSQGVSFGDLQMGAYVAELTPQDPMPIFSQSLTPARKFIRYPLFYGDYGGMANVEFYVRPVSKYQLVLVFMGSKEDEKQSILRSVTIPNLPNHR